MGLTAVVNLVLEHVQQQPVPSLGLDPGITIDAHEARKRLLGQGLADGDQTAVHRALFPLKVGNSGARLLVGESPGSEPSALQAIDVEPVDDQYVVERGLD